MTYRQLLSINICGSRKNYRVGIYVHGDETEVWCCKVPEGVRKMKPKEVRV